MKRIVALIPLTFLGCYAIHQSTSPVSASSLKESVGRYLFDTSIIVEAGAYNGCDTVELSKTFPSSSIYAFEPVPQIFKELQEKVEGINNIYTFPLALSDSTGCAKMHISKDPSKPESPSQSSSLLAPKDHLLYAPNVSFNEILEVPTISLDDWAESNGIDHVDLLWLDMQGYELNMLRASQRVLKQVKVIVTEVEFVEAYEGQYLFNDVKSWLESEGFEMIEIHYQSWFGDAIFINRKAINDDFVRKITTIFEQIASAVTTDLTIEENDTHHLQDNFVDSQPVIE